MSSPTVGKGGNRKDASFCDAVIAEVNTVVNIEKVKETVINL